MTYIDQHGTDTYAIIREKSKRMPKLHVILTSPQDVGTIKLRYLIDKAEKIATTRGYGGIIVTFVYPSTDDSHMFDFTQIERGLSAFNRAVKATTATLLVYGRDVSEQDSRGIIQTLADSDQKILFFGWCGKPKKVKSFTQSSWRAPWVEMGAEDIIKSDFTNDRMLATGVDVLREHFPRSLARYEDASLRRIVRHLYEVMVDAKTGD